MNNEVRTTYLSTHGIWPMARAQEVFLEWILSNNLFSSVFFFSFFFFCFCFPMSPFRLNSPVVSSRPPGRTTHDSGVLRLPYGDSSILEVSVLGNICGLRGPSQVWGFPQSLCSVLGRPLEASFL